MFLQRSFTQVFMSLMFVFSLNILGLFAADSPEFFTRKQRQELYNFIGDHVAYEEAGECDATHCFFDEQSVRQVEWQTKNIYLMVMRVVTYLLKNSSKIQGKKNITLTGYCSGTMSQELALLKAFSMLGISVKQANFIDFLYLEPSSPKEYAKRLLQENKKEFAERFLPVCESYTHRRPQAEKTKQKMEEIMPGIQINWFDTVSLYYDACVNNPALRGDVFFMCNVGCSCFDRVDGGFGAEKDCRCIDETVAHRTALVIFCLCNGWYSWIFPLRDWKSLLSGVNEYGAMHQDIAGIIEHERATAVLMPKEKFINSFRVDDDAEFMKNLRSVKLKNLLAEFLAKARKEGLVGE